MMLTQIIVILSLYLDIVVGQDDKFEYECDILQRMDTLEKQVDTSNILSATAAKQLGEAEKRLDETVGKLHEVESRLDAAEFELKEQQKEIDNLTSQIAGSTYPIHCPDTWTVFNRSCYLFANGTQLGFFEAKVYCENLGGTLVHIDNADENAFLEDYVRRYETKFFWIGLTDESVEGEWIWSDTQLAPDFTYWRPGEPSNDHGNEDCAHIYPRIDFKWNDIICTFKCNPLCELKYA